MPLTDLSDVELLDRVRAGCSESYSELWLRHWRPVVAFAGRYKALSDPDDLAQEAFLRVHQSLVRGGGPHHSFRPYAYRTVRNVAVSSGRAAHEEAVGSLEDLSRRVDPGVVPGDLTEDVLERSITVRAFNHLPPRWQEVLWYTVVEGLKPREVAPLIGVSPNAVSALALRAREGLRQEWLRAHTRTQGVAEDCRRTVAVLPEYARGSLARHRSSEVLEHLDRCPRCTVVHHELEDLAASLRTVLPPILLLPCGAGLTLLGPSPASTGASGTESSRPGTSSPPAPASPSTPGGAAAAVLPLVTKVVSVACASAILGLGAWGALSLPGDGAGRDQSSAEVVAGPRPSSPRSTASPAQAVQDPWCPETAADPLPADTQDERSRTADDTPATEKRQALPPPDEAPGGTTSVGTGPAVDLPQAPPPTDPPGEVAAPPVVLITGPPPGSSPLVPEIIGSARPDSEITLLDESGALVGSTTAGADGRWALVPAGIAAGTHRFRAVADDGFSDLAGPYELLAPEILRPSQGQAVPAGDGTDPGSVASVVARMQGLTGMSARMVLDGVRVSAWHSFGARPIDVHFSDVAPGEHTLAVQYVDVATGRVGAPRTVTFSVVVPDGAT